MPALGTDPDDTSGATSYGAVKPQLSLLIWCGSLSRHLLLCRRQIGLTWKGFEEIIVSWGYEAFNRFMGLNTIFRCISMTLHHRSEVQHHEFIISGYGNHVLYMAIAPNWGTDKIHISGNIEVYNGLFRENDPPVE